LAVRQLSPRPSRNQAFSPHIRCASRRVKVTVNRAERRALPGPDGEDQARGQALRHVANLPRAGH